MIILIIILVAGAASERAAKLKNDKYQELKRTYLFCPVAIETLGPINEEGERFLACLGRRLSASSANQERRLFCFNASLSLFRDAMPSRSPAHLTIFGQPMRVDEHTFFLTPNFINPAGTEYRG